MDKFIEQHADGISGILGCFDRVLFRGYLPIMSGDWIHVSAVMPCESILCSGRGKSSTRCSTTG